MLQIISDDIIVYPDNADFGLSDNCLQFMNDILDKNPDTRIGSANNGCETQVSLSPSRRPLTLSALAASLVSPNGLVHAESYPLGAPLP